MTAAAAKTNERRAPRKSVLSRGRLTFDKGRTSLPCTIRDLSQTGARIELSGARELPAILHLIDIHGRTAYEASVKWRRGSVYGLAFIETLPLSSNKTPLALRKLWIANMR